MTPQTKLVACGQNDMYVLTDVLKETSWLWEQEKDNYLEMYL